MTRPPSISVVIPTYQRRASVRRALEALAAQTLPAEAFEVVVCIDGSTDGTREMIAGLAVPYTLRAVWRPNAGRAAARNLGVAESRGGVLVFLDDDMEPYPGCLAAHAEAHARHGRCCVIGAAPISEDVSPAPTARFVAANFNRHLAALASPGHAIGVRDFYSGNFSVPREVFAEVGGFDEAFRIYGNEDVELAARLMRAGVALLFSPEAAARQHYEKGFVSLARDHIEKGVTAVMCARKHPDAIPRLRLGTYWQHSRRWRLARAALLAVSDPAGRVPSAAIHLVEWAGRRWPAELLRCYPLVLDYCFWFGVRQALREDRGASIAAAVYARPSRERRSA